MVKYLLLLLQVVTMAQKVVYEKYVNKLGKCLPMDDNIFIAKLSIHKLLPGDINDRLKALPTPVAKASYLLDHVVEPALEIDDTSSFDYLLSVMEHCGYSHVEKLAREIKSVIDKANISNDIEPGMMFQYVILIYKNCEFKKVGIDYNKK